MKNILSRLKKSIISLSLMMIVFQLDAQISAFNYTIANDIQVTDRIFEFDLYLLDTDAGEQFELGAIQAGIIVNPGIYNGGTITLSIVSGSSQLNASQQPTSVVFTQAQNTIKLTPKLPPGAGLGTIISQTAPGTRICRLRVTNSAAFTGNTTADLTFNFTTVPYATKVSQYLSGINTELTCNSANCFSNAANIVLNPPIPDIPVATEGSGALCTQITANWQTATGATSYRLDVSTSNIFSSYVSGYQDLDVGNVLTYDVSGLTAGTPYYYRLRAVNSYGASDNSNTISYSTSPATPAIPGTITGTSAQCPALTGQVYNISAVTNATSYTWTVPTGWTITGGQGTTTLTVTTGTAGQNGNIGVTASNSCGTSLPGTLAVTVTAIPATPGAISGTSGQCPALTGQIYSISAVASATTYTWTVPTGWSITGGQGTTSVTITTGSAGQNGDIGVTAGNSCGTSTASTLAVTVLPGTPATPGTITGTAAQCPALSGQIYSISAVTNATSYTWTVPTGWAITGGTGTTSITVTTGTAGQGGDISVTASNSCGTSSARTLAVTVQPGTPATPGVITGTTPQCPALTSQTYSISAVTNATTYTWAVPTGWAITAGSGTTSITVTTGSSGQNGSISVTAGNSCGTSAASTLAVTILPGTPATPGTITGTGAQCPELADQVYSISSVTNATSYAWTVPTGWTITAGQGTTSLTVTTGTEGQNGNISVTASNSCGTSAARTLAVTVQPGTPATPGTITGTTAQCPSLTGQTYSISSVTGATSYAWTVPTGWTITGGQGTITLTVTTGTAGQNGNIGVNASNSCGTSSQRTLAVTVTAIPATPGTISGTSAQCPALTGQIYSISAVASATTYTWVVPTGWSITGGQGTTSVTITTGSAGQNGDIGVTAGNSCGTSTASTLAVTVLPGTPATPGTITGTAAQCPALSGQIYSISAVTNATSYTWTVPTGWAITGGTGTTSITVTTGTAGQNGNISVTASNSCGTSSARTLAVTVQPGTPTTPGTISGTGAQCPVLPGQIYSISAVTDATTYAWVVPTGWAITAGSGTTSITVTTGSSGQNGNIGVTAGNSCGTSAARTLAVTVLPGTPATPGTITGTAGQCPALTGQIYSISTVTDATSYAWTVPTGWTITAGQGTTSLTVSTGTAGQNGNIGVTASNSCGTSSARTLAVTVQPGTPATPGTITGTAAQCPAVTGQIYSISTVTDATSYTWTVPTGWTITGGQGTTALTVTTGTAGQNGNIGVTASNSCGTSSPRTLAVTVTAIPATPGAISGTSAQCPALTGQIYSISAVASATTYTWTVPTGWSITGGQGTTSVTVTTGSAGQNGNISVTAGNICGTSSPNTLAVTVLPGTPATPGTITGTAAQCPALTGQIYSISAVTNATSYTWTVPIGWAITGGTGTTSITVTTGAADQGGNITVTAGNSCGTSSARTLAVTVQPGTPATPGSITGTTAQCPALTGQEYSISSVTNATTYTWTLPTGWAITAGQGTVSVTVTTGSSGQNGNISVTAGNSCGTSTASTLAVTVLPGTPATPGTITGTTSQCPALTGQVYSISSVTNATSYTWTVPTGWAITAGQGTTSLTVTTGTAGQNGNISVTASNSCGTSSARSLLVAVNSGSTAPSGVSITNNNTCSGTLKTLTVTGGSLGTGAIWEWFSGSCGGTAEGTGLSITVDPAAGSSTLYYVRATGTCNTTLCANGTVVVTPTVGTPSTPVPSASSICQGSANTTYTTSATNATGYIWSVTGAGNTISGTGTTGTVTWSPSFSGVATISVVANGCNGPSASSSTSVTVNALPVPTLTSSDPDNKICTGSSVTFTAGGGTNYNFRINGTGVQNGSLETFTTTTLANGQIVDVIVTNSSNCTAVSAGITNTVYALPVPTLISSDGDNIFCAGSTITFTAGGGNSYNFRIGGVNAQTGPSNIFATSSLTNAQIVDVIVTNTVTGCSAGSVQIPNFVNPLPSIFVTTAPTCSPDLLTYSLGVTVSGGVVTSTAGTVVNTSGNIWTISGVNAGTNITVRVTDPATTCQNVLSVTSPDCSCPVINAPVSGGDKGYCATGTVPTITASVSTGETVDWYSASSGGALLRYGNTSYTPPAAGTYWALARNTTSGCKSSTRTPVIVTMYALPIPTLSSSDIDNKFCTGTNVTFTAGGGTSYNFRIGGVSVQSGTLNTYTTNSLANGQVVDVVVTNENYCIATSSGITNTVYDLPVPSLSSSDTDNTFCVGTTIIFTATGGTNYNFRVGGVSIQSGNTPTYTTSSLANGQVVDVIVTNINGCSATSSGITNTVNPLPTPTITSSDNDNIICAGNSVTFTATGGTNYNFRAGGTSMQNGSLATYTTTALIHNQVVDVIVTNSNGCSAASSGIATTVYAVPVANAGSGGNECDLTYQLNAIPSTGIGTWTRTSGPGTASFSPSSNSPNAIVTVSQYGTYTFTWTEVNGICSDNDVITVNFYLQPVANPGTGGNNCGLTFHLSGSMNVGTGTWTKQSGPGNVSFSPTINTPAANVTVTAYGSYTFRWTVVNGSCAHSTTVDVAFFEQPASDAGDGGDECDLDFVLNAVAVAAPGTWTMVSGPGSATFNPSPNNPGAIVSVSEFGTYDFAWTIVNSTCQSTDNISVTFHDLPAVSAGRDTIICEDGSAQLQATGTGAFLWSPASSLNDPVLAAPIASPGETTTFTVTLTDQFGCQNTDEVDVEVWNMPVADAGPDLELAYVFETDLQAVALNVNETGTWSVTSGSGTFTDPNDTITTLSGLETGENIILWRVSNGVCPDVDDYITILVKDLLIPSLITPNGDPWNEYFYLGGLLETLGTTELTIFDRRGALVYKNGDYDNSWNGLDNNGKELPEDTYFYVLKSQNSKSLSGYIIIRR